eukprot:TRINITY_DN544_c0_g1_i4.p1 TRINITY_DN544_c0_g1~~TRINITY_DN544_c0_g1_i4.p1  ORF type:complete len:359 (-),score=103.68 TRINITY_DN544_c0_g1_i4:358-1284(-)
MDHYVQPLDPNTLGVFGGWSGPGLFLNDTWRIAVPPSGGASQWEQLVAKNNLTDNRRADHVMIVTNDANGPTMRAFAGGSYPSDFLYNNFVNFDVNALKWSNGTASGTLPPPMNGHAAAMINGDTQMVVFGGNTDDGTINDVYLYTIANDSWSKPLVSGPAPSPRLWHTAVSFQDQRTLFVFGGFNQGSVYQDMWILNTDTWVWKKWTPGVNAPVPSARAGHIAVGFANKMFVFGGQEEVRLLNDLWEFDLNTNQWKQLNPTGDIPAPRVGAKGAVFSEARMILFGGCLRNLDDCSEFENDLWSFPLS